MQAELDPPDPTKEELVYCLQAGKTKVELACQGRDATTLEVVIEVSGSLMHV